MLIQLTIRNYALIQTLDLAPAQGMNIITGETGAGKSIMLGAIGLLLGQRADAKSLSNESEKCVIEGRFDVGAYHLQAVFAANDWEYDDETVIRREINASGKSRIFINDSPVTLEEAKELGSKLIDIHSQHDTLKLGSQAWQLGLVDDFGNLQAVKTEYQEVYRRWRIASKALAELKEKSVIEKKEADYLKFQYQELKAAQLELGEKERLEKDLDWLQNQEQVKSLLSEIVNLLDSTEVGVVTSISKAIRATEKLTKYRDACQDWTERLEVARVDIADIVASVYDLVNSQDVPEQSIDAIEDRLSLLYQLEKKHGLSSVEELVVLRDALKARLQQINSFDDQIADAQLLLDETESDLAAKASSLTNKRKDALSLLAAEITERVAALSMPNAIIEAFQESTEYGIDGADKIKLLFSANKGVKPAELSKVASGGEFSRLMLAVKSVMAQKVAMPTLIFDEIDSGISGETGKLVGKMIKAMSTNHQVITITHLPQMAAFGEKHFFVYKDHTGERTYSSIKELSEEERVNEIAQMVSGADPSPAAIATAKELLKDSVK